MNKQLFLISIAVCFTFCQNMIAQTKMDALFDNIRNEDNATSIHLGRFTMTIASFFTETFGVHEIDIVKFEDCDKAKLKKYIEAARALDCSAFDSQISDKDGDEYKKVLIRTHDDKIQEIVILKYDKNEIALVRIQGNINPSDVEHVINRHSNEG